MNASPGSEGAAPSATYPNAERPLASSGRHSEPVTDIDRSELAAHRDRVRWGPLWAGVLVTLASFLVMQLVIFAADLFDDDGSAGTWLTVAAGVVAFFLGGVTAGAGALWHSVSDGIFNGAVLWALATVGLLMLGLIGGGTLLGPVSTVASDLGQVQDLNLRDLSSSEVNNALSDARTAAWWSVGGLLVALLASAVGGAVGARIWPDRATPGTTVRGEGRTGLH